MARRPVFLPDPAGPAPVRPEMVEFQWHPGLALSQKQKSVAALHEAAGAVLGVDRILEVSSKSTEPLGVALSAFNLQFRIENITAPVSVESAFQSSKVFERGGPYTDLLGKPSIDAKRDERLKTSGRLIEFRFLGTAWPLEPQTAFYDWLYIRALLARPDLAAALAAFDAFTDIEFNPEKSINCQAYAVALFRSLARRGELEQAASSPQAFLDLMRPQPVANARQNDTVQGRLF